MAKRTTNGNLKAESRRAAKRLPMAAMVSYSLDGQEYGNLAADISQDGIFIRTLVPPPVGTQLSLTVEMSERMGGYLLHVDGVVVRVVDDEKDPRQNGMGVHFTAVHASEPDTVRYLIARIFRFDVLEQNHQ